MRVGRRVVRWVVRNGAVVVVGFNEPQRHAVAGHKPLDVLSVVEQRLRARVVRFAVVGLRRKRPLAPPYGRRKRLHQYVVFRRRIAVGKPPPHLVVAPNNQYLLFPKFVSLFAPFPKSPTATEAGSRYAIYLKSDGCNGYPSDF